MTIKNSKTLPRVYYGLHMAPGVAEYAEPGKEPYRIMIGEEAIKNMDETFAGRPVYVKHVEKVDLANIQEEADGYVVESFFNQLDGKHWAKFIVVSDRGHEAIRNGWKLSNAYLPKEMAGGGLWHGVEFAKEVTRGEYEHLAIVPNPRYSESEILTPEQFKAYNSEKELELLKVANSNGKDEGESNMFQIFKKTKVENSMDLEGHTVVLPLSKKEMTLGALVNSMDAIENMMGYANGDHMVKVGEEEMSVNQLAKAYGKMKNAEKEAEEAKKNAEMADKEKGEKKENEDEMSEEDKKKKKENEDKEASEKEEKKQNEIKLADEEKIKNAHFEALKNAPASVIKDEQKLDLSEDKAARGKSRYGSN